MAKETMETAVPKKMVIDVNTKFDWAFNKIKLGQAIKSVIEAKKLDSSVVLNEETVKEAYIARAGLLTKDEVENKLKKRPRSTSNIRE